MTETVLDRITRLLDSRSVTYEMLRHEPVYTSEAAAKVRGTSLASGAKALICKADGKFVMFVVPASLRLDSKRIRRGCGIRSLRFANQDEVGELTGLKPGSIPPFGSFFSVPTYCDKQLGEQQQINFNAGDHCVSISMSFSDYVDVEQPQLGAFSH